MEIVCLTCPIPDSITDCHSQKRAYSLIPQSTAQLPCDACQTLQPRIPSFDTRCRGSRRRSTRGACAGIKDLAGLFGCFRLSPVLFVLQCVSDIANFGIDLGRRFPCPGRCDLLHRLSRLVEYMHCNCDPKHPVDLAGDKETGLPWRLLEALESTIARVVEVPCQLSQNNAGKPL